jgi:acyl carrier protein
MADAEAVPPAIPPRPNRWRIVRPRIGALHGSRFASAADLEAWITDWIAAKLRVPRADVERDRSFNDFGLDSMAAVELSGRLEQVTGRVVAPSIAWEYPTIAELAGHLLPDDTDATAGAAP